MALTVEKGRITFKGDVESGVSKNGYSWARQTVVVEIPSYQGQYRLLALIASGNNVRDLEGYPVGAQVEVKYSVSSREWKGRYFTNVDLFSISSAQKEEAAPTPAPAPVPEKLEAPVGSDIFDPAAHGDDLPF